MKFCDDCRRSMIKKTSGGIVEFVCVCGKVQKGSPEDASIHRDTTAASEALGRYAMLIKNAPFDPTNQRVMKDCPCGLDYQVQLRLGESEVVITACKCGRTSRG